MDIAYKNEFARLEAEQEAAAFMSKIEIEDSMNFARLNDLAKDCTGCTISEIIKSTEDELVFRSCDVIKTVKLVNGCWKEILPAASTNKRVWTEDEIKNLIQTNDKVLYGALKNLYACQTSDEQVMGTTKENNGAGFNGLDAPILSSFCEFLNKTGFLTPKQKVIARKKLVKYNKQLTKLANGR